jgi:uncharacterized protein
VTTRGWLLGCARAAVLWGCVFGAPGGAAVAQVAVPPLTAHVVDQTGTLTAAQSSALEQKLTAFEARKGSQLAVLLVPSTAPESIEQYALRVAEQWKLGRRKVDDGVLLLVAVSDRKVRIEVGYGLEGALTDVTSQRIISETIVPRFKQQDLPGGVAAGVDQIIRVVEGEPLPAAPASPSSESAGSQLGHQAPLLFILALAVGGALRRALGRLAGASVTGVVVAALAWFVVGSVWLALLAGGVALFATLLGGAFGVPGLGGFHGGGGRGGGGGGGGFTGGGGSFGGGGASGRW